MREKKGLISLINEFNLSNEAVISNNEEEKRLNEEICDIKVVGGKEEEEMETVCILKTSKKARFVGFL